MRSECFLFLLFVYTILFNFKVDAFLISIAFSLVFGAIFMKTWRIYKIFTNVKLSKQVRRELELYTLKWKKDYDAVIYCCSNNSYLNQ